MKKKVLFFLLALVNTVYSQKNIPINVAVFNEATAVPFTTFITTPIHPGLQVGTEFNYNKKEHTRLFQTANISYFFHNYLEQGVGINSELGYEYRFKSGIALESLLGIGYMHTFATTKQEYTLINGDYILKTDLGNSRLYPSLAFDVGYYLKKADAHSSKVFFRYQVWAEYPYSPGFIPVLTHANLYIGIKFFIKNQNKNVQK